MKGCGFSVHTPEADARKIKRNFQGNDSICQFRIIKHQTECNFHSCRERIQINPFFAGMSAVTGDRSDCIGADSSGERNVGVGGSGFQIQFSVVEFFYDFILCLVNFSSSFRSTAPFPGRIPSSSISMLKFPEKSSVISLNFRSISCRHF